MTEGKSSVLEIINYLGASLIFFGIAYFISSNWDSLDNFLKILTTLGAALLTILLGCLCEWQLKYQNTAPAFFMLTGLLLPIGLLTTLNVFNINWSMNHTDIVISAIGTVLFISLHLHFHRTILLLFTIIYSSALLTSTVQHFVPTSVSYADNYYLYQIIVLGLGYLVLGHYLAIEKKYPLSGILYFFGTLQCLMGCFFLDSSVFYFGFLAYWKILSLLSISLAFIFAVPLKSKSMVYLAALFLIMYISELTYRFVMLFGNIAWSLVLILSGVMMILVGYSLVYMLKKYKSDPALKA